MSDKNELHVLNGRAAGFVTRLLAFSADLVVLAGIIAVGGWIAVLADTTLETLGVQARTELTSIYVILIPFIMGLYFVLLWSLTGRTIGKWFMGLKVVGSNGRPPTVGRSIVRVLGYLVSAVAFWIGYLWVIIDDDRKAWHDHMARTSVVYDYSRRAPGETYTNFLDQNDAA